MINKDTLSLLGRKEPISDTSPQSTPNNDRAYYSKVFAVVNGSLKIFKARINLIQVKVGNVLKVKGDYKAIRTLPTLNMNWSSLCGDLTKAIIRDQPFDEKRK
ncbi:hypothetical protein fh0823_24210 [Francisella halioticida]|uniref:hypothetical protein n=1 Tax=Francisella halioticida TaxID=549298 RepID=UPI001AF465ED|nr:hypothetical protein [Francisella halioticida]BCD92282.1 hypothetical protein fh0823_24210 [Francisella halioticida]